MRDNIKREGIYENFTKTIFVNSLFHYTDCFINQLLFYFKSKDKPDLQNKSSKTASKSEKKIEDQEITLTFSGDTMFDWQLRPIIEKNGADYPFQHVKEEIKKLIFLL